MTLNSQTEEIVLTLSLAYLDKREVAILPGHGQIMRQRAPHLSLQSICGHFAVSMILTSQQYITFWLW